MKVRSTKLREAHKPATSRPAFCSILYDQTADHIVTAASSEPSIAIHDSLLPSGTPRVLRHHRDGVTALALSPNSTCLASGSVDRSVKLYKFPGGEFQTNITRFTLPIRVLAFNKSGSMLAASGDDEGIKLINTIDGSIARVLKGHRGSITGLAFDPNGEYLVSLDSVGTVIFWELHSGNPLHTLKNIAPDIGLDTSVVNVLCWSPDGELLAVPGVKNDVVMYDRDTAEKLFSLRGEHSETICFLSWSPNGKYMATSGLDRQVLIWDVDKKQDIDRQKFDDRVSCMAWKPIGNALAVIDVMGKYGVWDSVVPSSMKSPTEDIPNLHSRNSNGLLLFDEEGEEGSMSGSLNDAGYNAIGESEPSSRKRLRKNYDDSLDEDINNDLSLSPKSEPRKKLHRSKESSDGNPGLKSASTSSKSKMQSAFQPGGTPMQPGKRNFLCYNMLGSITTMEHGGFSHIEIDFHDTSRGPRVPSMTDYFGFTMAALNENGSVFANPCKGEKGMSTLMYRPFSSWANNSEWSMRFEGEEVKVVALGTGWVAAVTSLNFLRIFTEGGLQRHVLSLDGPVVTASGFKDKLAVVTHVSDCLPSNDQVLEIRVFNISNGTQSFRGRLPVSPGSVLIWFGFSEEGHLSSYDSKGVLRVFTNQYGGSWNPLFSAIKQKSDDNYWVVGLNSSKLFCIVCKKPDLYPQVMPKPVLSLLDFSLPIASSDLGADALESEFILNGTKLSEIQRQMDEMAGAGLDASSLDDEAFNIEAAQDRCILRLIASCCNGDKLVRATELMKLLILEKSMRGAIKLVTTLKLPNLAERFNNILEERLLSETKGIKVSALQDTRASLTMGALVGKSSVEADKLSEPTVPLASAKLSAPIFKKKSKLQEDTKTVKDKVEQNHTVKNNIEVKNAGEATELDEVNKIKRVDQVQPQRPSNLFLKPSNKQDKPNDVNKVNQKQPKRPSNPFLKSSVR